MPVEANKIPINHHRLEMFSMSKNGDRESSDGVEVADFAIGGSTGAGYDESAGRCKAYPAPLNDLTA